MKTTVEKLSPTRVKLTIAVTPEELKPSIDHAYEHIGSQVTIPGFRKGKIPAVLIDQRVGRDEVLNHAVGDAIDGVFRDAVREEKLRTLGRPTADIATWPDAKTFTGDLVLDIEVDVRPEFDLPAYDGLALTVDAAAVSDDDVEKELEELRSRFGTLITVDRPATTGDFVQIDLVAKIGGREVDTASSISYELGSGELIEGIDDALDGLSAGEQAIFESTLLGGDNAGETAEITVDVLSVKERELPDADDDFAQISSQFDTIAELKADLAEQLEKSAVFAQGAQARDLIVDELLKSVEIPVPQQLIDDEVKRHLEAENRTDDEEHGKEVAESSEKTFRSQILLDAIVEKEEIKVSQNELTQYLIQGAAQYGMEPGEFIQVLDNNGQIPSMIAEVARNKALALVLGRAKVTDSNQKVVDLTEFTAVFDEPTESDEEQFDPTATTSLLDAADDDHAGHSH
ncbi:trigger factor [Galbitalea sp. SE-J8]|uniref:trigger factor n=1 Tax=Galbitalea sp. SE-J8 TaxID=3054952 RepID=UPI00338FB6F6